MNLLRAFRNEKAARRKEIASDILTILVIVKFALEFSIKYGDFAVYLGAAFMIAGLLTVAIRLAGIKNLISVAAIILFLIDYNLRAGPAGSVIFITLIIVLICFYFILKVIG